eukprot:CAMPEP_0201870386 /NCGR_PEP_ID=MMETSP0902-20130614/3494_1 /ASSEMBLY_ACC=CAM_ASM_000551 /TAXON_ID=420261 /ORGANISM="Thalassiosira antarctica, Strain CCMP982" /LENGTH=107 /DNA_ID=CAMNT_0048395977 /DNA_START=534 /DNA_END=854 /DNA_ORIENTATION=+
MAKAGDVASFSRPDILWADTSFSITFSISMVPATDNMTTGRLTPVPMGMMVVKDTMSAKEDAAGDASKVQKKSGRVQMEERRSKEEEGPVIAATKTTSDSKKLNSQL